MASRGRQTFNKRLKEQQRKEKQQEKFARKLQKKDAVPNEDGDDLDVENPALVRNGDVEPREGDLANLVRNSD